MSVALPSGANYQLKPTSVKANRKTINCISSNKLEFSPEETAHVYIPALRNAVADPASAYLKFKLTIATDTASLDNSAMSLIERIVVYHAGNVLSDINCYRSLASAYLDLTMSQSQKIGMSATLGTEEGYTDTVAGTFATAGSPTASEVSALFVNANRSGLDLAVGSYSYCIPLIGPIFSGCDKFLPLYALSDDIRVEITFASASNALVKTGSSSPTFTISNPTICLDIIELESSVISLIQQTYSGKDLILSCVDHRYYASQIASSTSGNISQILPCKAQSARMAVFKFRCSSTQSVDSYSSSSSVNPFYTANDEMRIVCGGETIWRCKTDVTGQFAPWMASTMNGLHAFSNPSDLDGSLNDDYYNVYPASGKFLATTNSYRNGFVLCANLNSLHRQDTAHSGRDLSKVTTTYEGYIATAPTVYNGSTTQSVTVDTFVQFDTLLIVSAETGQMSARW